MPMTDAPEWGDILHEPFVGLILGQRGAGKTALGHLLMETFHTDERDAYILGYPEAEADALPEWASILPTDTGRDQWPEDSVVLIHEAHHILHARRSQQSENLEIDTLITVSRHKNSDIIIETQQSQRLDRNMVTAADAVIFREPALMQAEFERGGMKKLVNRANDVFNQYVETVEGDGYTYREKSDDVLRTAYVHADRFDGEYPHDIPLADHWSEDISRAYASASMDEVTGEGSEDSDDYSEDELTCLKTVAEYEVQQRPFDFTVRGVDHDDIPTVMHAWNQLKALRASGLIRKVYESNNNPSRYRMTAEGWEVTAEKFGITEPEEPVGDDPDEVEWSPTAG
jgi:Zonular occludens toxin (Zot).